MLTFLEIIQILSTLAGFPALIPEIVKIFNEKQIATSILNVGSLSLYVTDTLLRLPNIGRGLFIAIQKRNKEEIKRNSIMAFGIWIMNIMNYIILLSIGIFNTGTKNTEEKRIKLNNFLKVTLSILGISIISFIIYGFNFFTITLNLIVLILCIIKILIFSKDKKLIEENKNKRNAIVLSILFGQFILLMMIYYFMGIRNALFNKKIEI